jgi:hypothetical protein
MSKTLNSRIKLFERFSKQLHLLKDAGILNIDLKYDETYICPICLEQFQKSDLISDNSKNFLTEEDAPPAKLNGSRIALTCYQCNSKAGHEIDHHLIHRIREIDDSKFHKDTVQQVRVEFEDTFVNSQITSEGNGLLRVLHKIDNNNPNTLDRFIYQLKNKSLSEILNMTPKKKKIEDSKVDKALLKSNYIITFSKFGYIFILDDYYNSIRREIKEPELATDGHLMINNQFERNQVGTYYVHNSLSKSIFNIFSLKTDYSETLIGALLPFPNMSPEELNHNLISNGDRIGDDKVGVVLDTTNYDLNVDLFSDLTEIKRILNWIKNAQ